MFFDIGLYVIHNNEYVPFPVENCKNNKLFVKFNGEYVRVKGLTVRILKKIQ